MNIMDGNKKSGFVALIGRPNVGKSTLMNRIIGQKVAITSRKPQTTRNRIRGIYTCESGQLVFLDTPGIHKAKNRLGSYMVEAAKKSLLEADAVLWLVEAGSDPGEGDRQIAKLLVDSRVPSILVVNKCDRIKKDLVADTLERYETLGEFKDVFAVSAKHGTNVGQLLDALFAYMPYGPMYYDEYAVTDQSVRQIAAEIIREKALRLLGEEVPHGIAVTIEKMQKRSGRGITDVEAIIICEKASHKGMIIGKNGSMLKQIGSDARADIEDMVQSRVNLQLWVKLRKEWRDSNTLLKNYGYDKSEL